jgi:hybrid polyketide synthase/nonribosomal peptide synthetase ACE1
MRLSPDLLGVDSLVAVDVQSWFRKELGIDMPVMKVLNAPSFDHLLTSAREMLAPEIVPKLLQTDISSFSSSNAEVDSHGTAPAIMPIPSPDSSVDSPSPSPVPESDISADEVISTDLSTAAASTGEPEATHASFVPSLPSSMTRSVFERIVPLSFAQTRFWFLRHLAESQTTFNVTTLLRLKGALDTDRLARAVLAVSHGHEALRTAFFIDEQTKLPLQGVLPTSLSPLRLEHATLRLDDDSESEIAAAAREIQNHVYDLFKGETLRIKLLLLVAEDGRCEEHRIILGYHHIAMDGIGHALFLSHLEKAYLDNSDVPLLPGPGAVDRTSIDMLLQYPDFALRQIREQEQGAWNADLEYWRGHFTGLPRPLPPLALSSRRGAQRPEQLPFASNVARIELDPQLKRQIEEACRGFRVAPVHFYLAAVGVLLSRHTANADSDEDGDENAAAKGGQDLCIGLVHGNRRDADVRRSLGLFLDLVPIRLHHHHHHPSTRGSTLASGHVGFADALRATRTSVDEALAHARPPLEAILSAIGAPRPPNRTPLFQVLFNYRPGVRDAGPFCGCEASGAMMPDGASGGGGGGGGGGHLYDIGVDILDSTSGGGAIEVAVNAGLYGAEDAYVLARSYLALLRGFAKNPAIKVVKAPLYCDEDVQDAVERGRGECPSGPVFLLTITPFRLLTG